MSAYIDYVKENYGPETVLLEIGAGHRSTKAFAEHFNKMYSVEHNPRFCNLYHDNYLQIPLDVDGWYNSEKFDAAIPDDYDLVILDELNVALDYKLLKLSDVKTTLCNVPDGVEVIITGRAAHPDIVKLADLVSEIKEVKHYYRKGVRCRKGIEY